jgi:hypothetical protein
MVTFCPQYFVLGILWIEIAPPHSPKFNLRWFSGVNAATLPLIMKRIFWQVMIVVLFAIRLSGQPSLQFFTNQANALLESSFGFGVGNIPVYCSTNSSIGYSASLHYLLQSAANNYDANTPASNFHSVFRPLFGWSSNTLFIVGYTNVATDFYTQTARGFKEPSDSTICTNDNV